MFYNILEQIYTIMMETYQNCIEQHSIGYSKGKHFPRQTRRSSHVWLRKLVSLGQNFSSVSERTFQIESIFSFCRIEGPTNNFLIGHRTS